MINLHVIHSRSSRCATIWPNQDRGCTICELVRHVCLHVCLACLACLARSHIVYTNLDMRSQICRQGPGTRPNWNSAILSIFISRCFICHSLRATKQELACLMSDRQTWIGVLDVYNQKPTWHDRWYWENKWHLDKNNDDAAVNLNLVNLNLQMSKWLFSFLIKAIKHKNKTYSV